MDGDFAPMKELAMLRKKHGFLLVIDDVSILNSLVYVKLFGAVLRHYDLLEIVFAINSIFGQDVFHIWHYFMSPAGFI